MIALISMMTLLEIKIKARTFDGIHMIAFPTAFLFFPSAFDLKITSILQVILLVYGQFVFINLRHSKNTQKGILDLSLIISLAAQFNNLFSIFYLLPLLILFQRGLKDIKHILALLLPVFIIPFTFASLSVILPPEIFELINPALQIKLLSLQTLYYGDIIWLAFLLTSFIICTIGQSKGNKKFSYPQLFSNFLYMAFWLFFSIAYELLGQETYSERWFISFVPGAYFFGGFLESIKSDSLKNILFTILILGILLFKLFDQGIISLQLPFLN
ncbi:MAG: hypothetical protein VXW04_01695 [Bacteroidota bacterium]|nr:hypothetical protein [Bacteroidota bacterium]